LAGPDEKELLKIIEDIKGTGLKVTMEGDIGDFLGVNINRLDDGTIELTQPHLIDQILKDLHLDMLGVSPKPTPASTTNLLPRFLGSASHDDSFDYRSVIGKMNYLEQSTRPDISYAVHQSHGLLQIPKQHSKAVRWIGK
jgi:hypothetical protein